MHQGSTYVKFFEVKIQIEVIEGMKAIGIMELEGALLQWYDILLQYYAMDHKLCNDLEYDNASEESEGTPKACPTP